MPQKGEDPQGGDDGATFTIDVQDPLLRVDPPRGRGPYFPYVHLRERGQAQRKVVIPTSSKSRECLQACGVPQCVYVAQSKAEMRRHYVIHHCDLPVADIPEAAPLPRAEVVAGPRLFAGAKPKIRPRRSGTPAAVAEEDWLGEEVPGPFDAQAVQLFADDYFDDDVFRDGGALAPGPPVGSFLLRNPQPRCRWSRWNRLPSG